MTFHLNIKLLKPMTLHLLSLVFLTKVQRVCLQKVFSWCVLFEINFTEIIREIHFFVGCLVIAILLGWTCWTMSGSFQFGRSLIILHNGLKYFLKIYFTYFAKILHIFNGIQTSRSSFLRRSHKFSSLSMTKRQIKRLRRISDFLRKDELYYSIYVVGIIHRYFVKMHVQEERLLLQNYFQPNLYFVVEGRALASQ